MKSVTVPEKEQIIVAERAVPEPKAGEVRIKVMACAVDEKDVRAFQSGPDAPEGAGLGRGFAGLVDAVGEGVSRLQAGDRVCADPKLPGGFAGYCIAPQERVAKLDDGLPFEEASLAVKAALTGDTGWKQALAQLASEPFRPASDLEFLNLEGLAETMRTQTALLAGGNYMVNPWL